MILDRLKTMFRFNHLNDKLKDRNYKNAQLIILYYY